MPVGPIDLRLVTTRYLDEFVAGQVFELGSVTMEKDDIVAFAQSYDPQSFHIDEDAAAKSIYGGLIASGWHTACAFMSLLANNLLVDAASMGSSGLDSLRWILPVRPGDRLTATLEITKVRVSDSRPDRGKVYWHADVKNQDGRSVMTLDASFMIGQRPSEQVS